MTRATKEAVIGIVEWEDGSYDKPLIPLEPFINQAHVLTDWLESKDSKNELSDDLLTQIEVQLAAHFYAVQRDPQYQSESTSGASGSFQGQTGLSLQATHYGQTAMLFDVTGVLTKRNLEAQQGKRVSKTHWIGWQDHSEDPYP